MNRLRISEQSEWFGNRWIGTLRLVSCRNTQFLFLADHFRGARDDEEKKKLKCVEDHKTIGR
jgi:hypothetical protein